MNPRLIRLNKILYMLCVAAGFAWIVALAMPMAGAWRYHFNAAPWDNEIYAPKAPAMLAQLPERNIFDPSGQTWQGKAVRAATNDAPASSAGITGIIDIPGVRRGVMSGGKFVPIGSEAAGGSVEAIENGKVRINSSQGVSEVDINESRERQKQSLGIRIQ